MAIVTGRLAMGAERASSARIAVLLGLAVLILAGLVSWPAEAVEFGCRIGKPSYCFKYGQMFCLKENSRSDRQQACADWTSACLACHAQIPECLGGERPPHKSPLCLRCAAEWHGCMHEIDKLYWPNRRGKASSPAAQDAVPQAEPETRPDSVPQLAPMPSPAPGTSPPAGPAEGVTGQAGGRT